MHLQKIWTARRSSQLLNPLSAIIWRGNHTSWPFQSTAKSISSWLCNCSTGQAWLLTASALGTKIRAARPYMIIESVWSQAFFRRQRLPSTISRSSRWGRKTTMLPTKFLFLETVVWEKRAWSLDLQRIFFLTHIYPPLVSKFFCNVPTFNYSPLMNRRVSK